MPFHTDKSFKEVMIFLPAEFREESLDDIRVFCEQVEEVLDQLTRQAETEADKLFELWAEVKEKRSKKGGRPADTALDTAVMALANIYGDRTDTGSGPSAPCSTATTPLFTACWTRPPCRRSNGF